MDHWLVLALELALFLLLLACSWLELVVRVVLEVTIAELVCLDAEAFFVVD